MPIFRLANKRKAFAQRTRSNRLGDGVNSIASPLPVDADHPAALNRKCELPALQRKRSFAEQFAPPAVQRRDVGVIISRDVLEVIDGGDHLAGYAVALRSHS